jgi:hypothetical protein
MGINWAATLLAGLSLLLAVFPFIFYKYGPRIRSGSSFAPCMVSLGIFFIICRRIAHVGAGSQDRKGVGRREKKRDGRGIDTTHGLMADDMASLDIILVRHAFSRSSELQCT